MIKYQLDYYLRRPPHHLSFPRSLLLRRRSHSHDFHSVRFAAAVAAVVVVVNDDDERLVVDDVDEVVVDGDVSDDDGGDHCEQARLKREQQ